MNHSRLFASLLVTGALAVSAIAQSGSSAPAPASPGSTPATDRPAASSPTDMTSPTARPTPSSTDTTTPTLTPASPDSSVNSTTSGATNSSRANTNADLNASAGFYGPGASQFKNIDSDADGRISRAEFTLSATTAATLALDKNQDGTVSAEERAAATTTGEKKHWWSRSNKAAGDMDPAETFNKLDADNDGFLSQSEMASANAKLKK